MIDDNEVDYAEKSRNIFNLINKFRSNPRELARHLERLKKYLDKNTNILSEPDKIQIQMVEGENVFNEAIQYLKSLSPLPPFEWDDCLAQSAQEHVDDIGPKGLLLYQSSDGTEPEDRISKYGNYVDSLGENIDFGPNDEIGVIVSLTLDDGEEDNLFKNDYKKIGIACGPHQSEFQMCVMDMAYDFIPKGQVNNNMNNNNLNNNQNMNNNNDMNNNFNNEMNANEAVNHSPYVKLSLDNDDYKNFKAMDEEANRRNMMGNANNAMQNNNVGGGSEIDQLMQQVKVINQSKKVVKKTVEITTKITYTYEDGSQKEVNEIKTHVFNS